VRRAPLVTLVDWSIPSMSLVGRRRELREVQQFLERAERNSGSLLVFVGGAGSGKTALADATADLARQRGFDVLRGTPADGQPGRLVWAQLVRATTAPPDLAACLLTEPGPLDLDDAAYALATGGRRLIVVDDIDRGGRSALELLEIISARLPAGSVHVCEREAALNLA